HLSRPHAGQLEIRSVLMTTQRGFRVSVRSNVVIEIRPLDPGELQPERLIEDPLDASTRLSQNNLANGCLDGEYDFGSIQTARFFATLCLEFMQKLCEKSLASAGKAASDGDEAWRNPHVPDKPAIDPP
ncbi:MAG: hypothetical protein ACR2OM_12780, partial [Aestuariivirgaceae bacterium]